jgi:glycosyltransferase involved in cell wall biosynthesis
VRRQPRVLMIVENNAYPRDFRVRREALALRDAGFQVSVIAPKDPAQSWREQVEGVDVYRFPAPPGGNGILGYAIEFGYATLAMLMLTIWVAIRKGVDVIHAANPPDTMFVIGALFRLFGTRFVFDQHDLSPETYLSRFSQPRENIVYRTLRLFERLSFSVASIVISTNESYKRIAIERGGKRPEQVFVVRNGPPLAYQPMDPDPALKARAPHIIGYVGTIGPQDGLDYWLRAVHEMVHGLNRRDFLSVVIGDGDALPDVRKLAADLDVESHVLFTGRLPEREARKCLSAASICVQPDPLSPLNDKSTMNKLMEYMALGKPTVAFDLVETRFSAERAAIYVQPNDTREFARQVVRLMDDTALRVELGEIGRRRVASQLAWEYSVPRLIAAYREGLGISEVRGAAEARREHT